jgi:hypothetical protein
MLPVGDLGPIEWTFVVWFACALLHRESPIRSPAWANNRHPTFDRASAV